MQGCYKVDNTLDLQHLYLVGVFILVATLLTPYYVKVLWLLHSEVGDIHIWALQFVNFIAKPLY